MRPDRAPAQGASDKPPVTAGRTDVDVRQDFGAKGDGVTDDWRAIENAGLHLEKLGGGRMYFPAGHYKLPTFGFNVRARSNIEYCGDGHASWIDATNCGFSNASSDRGLVFTVGDFPRYTYFPARDIHADDRFVTCETAGDAARFGVGDFIYIRSKAATIVGKDCWPHFSEFGRVVSSDPTTGQIELEEAIEDGWKDIQVAKLANGIVAANYAIHDLRVTCSAGFPLFIMASYKSVIHDVWTEGWSALTVNAFTKSEFRDAICEVNWLPGANKVASAVEIETGSVGARVRNITCHIRSADGTQNPAVMPPLVFTQEFSRRTSVEDCRFLAPGLELGNGVFSIGAGHRYENLTFAAKSFDNIVRFVADDNLGPLNAVARNARNIRAEVTGRYNCAVAVIGTAKTACANIDVDDFRVTGPSDGAAVVLGATVRDVDLNNLDIRGNIDHYGDGTISNVSLRNSRLSGFANRDLLKLVDVVNFRRRDANLPPAVATSGERLVFANTPHTAFSAISIAADAKIVAGDAIDIHASLYKFKSAYAAHVAIRVFGTLVEAIDVSSGTETSIDIRARVQIIEPDKGRAQAIACLGTITRNAAVKNIAQKIVSFDTSMEQSVSLEVWGDWSGTSDNVSVRSSRIAYELVENKKPF